MTNNRIRLHKITPLNERAYIDYHYSYWRKSIDEGGLLWLRQAIAVYYVDNKSIEILRFACLDLLEEMVKIIDDRKYITDSDPLFIKPYELRNSYDNYTPNYFEK